ncbi:helix-turn-helix domain-containing protein [Mycobacteroides abscessus]|uniref:helix-turn-helix domain-containing protein n=1 Tax=Mycobacteroides abscessus TaxID=36809 RepID=UPI00148FC9FF|nr:helix-turn-helix transcriptional regulator [Mycobacteroides abscessus]
MGDDSKWVPQRVTEADVEIGRVLAAARERAGMQVREVAEASGIDRSVITRIELGQRPCRVAELAALADAYGVRPRGVVPRRHRRHLTPAPVTVRAA